MTTALESTIRDVAEAKTQIAKVRRAAARVERAKTELELRIREAHDAGASLREIAAAANVSHEQIRRVLR